MEVPDEIVQELYCCSQDVCYHALDTKREFNSETKIEFWLDLGAKIQRLMVANDAYHKWDIEQLSKKNET